MCFDRNNLRQRVQTRMTERGIDPAPLFAFGSEMARRVRAHSGAPQQPRLGQLAPQPAPQPTGATDWASSFANSLFGPR
jgi:hypothetical protein